MQKLIFQAKRMSQCDLKFQIRMQKLLKIGRLLFLIIFVRTAFFATLYSFQIYRTTYFFV